MRFDKLLKRNFFSSCSLLLKVILSNNNNFFLKKITINTIIKMSQASELWPRYWGFLLAAIILFIILMILFIFARLNYKDGRNFFAIFLCELLQIDLALDIAFIVL